jgi:hypothetical protein
VTGRALDPLSFQPELKHTAVRVEPAAAVALAGGRLAEAVARELEERGVRARRLELAELERAPAGVRRVVVAEAEPAGEPWWEVALASPDGPGVALLDLAAGPEPLAAMPALLDRGWRLGWRGERWLPEPVRRLVARWLRAGEEPAGLVVGGVASAPDPPAPAGALVLAPGGRLGFHAPVSGDPATLASYLSGTRGPRAALRRVVAVLSASTALVVAGDPLGDPDHDPEQGIDLLVHEDRVAGTAQVWRVAAGQVLGVAAVVPSAAADDVEALWLADPDPALLRRRFPVH